MKPKSFEQVLEEVKGKRILVANRGIPARRICRSITEMFDAKAIMTATDVDKTSPATSGANELLMLGPDPRAYLDLDRVIREAKANDIVAIHPGWGFGAEDDSFPAKCKKAGIIFIGPDREPMRILGNKVAVRKLAIELGVPVVPGSEGAVSIPEARQMAEEIGFPVMLKAEGGGGGRGIYEVYQEEDLESAFSKASALAQASFGNPRLYVEKLLTSVRHIEIQVISDQHGNVFCMDERDCSVQRNHQKLIEITPSPWPKYTAELRAQLKEYSKQLVLAVGYHSLATVEFLVDADGIPYLIEVNTRLQVEHGITECRYGIDLVEEQIAISFGSKLRLNEKTTKPYQWAMQCRINCEDPQKNFEPNSGRITRYVSPGGQGIRIDSCVGDGYRFPSNYDSAASLLIAYGNSWKKVVSLMKRSLREYMVGGLKTTIPFHRKIVDHPKFIDAVYDTNFVRQHYAELMDYSDREPDFLRMTRLVAEISAMGYNKYVQLGEYRNRDDKRVGRFELADAPEVSSWFEPRFTRSMDREAILDGLRTDREAGIIHMTDTTTRDITQSNSGNRFRLAEDAIIGPSLDKCGFFSLENGGGAHFHVAMLANMTYPFAEAAAWNKFAPDTLKQILIRSTNILGYKPQPKNVMRLTGEMINEHYDVIRCFDFLNHVENMQPFAEVAMNSKKNIFEPAISLSWAKGFDVERYLTVTDNIIAMCASAAGVSKKKAVKMIILGLKDMAGVCPPRFMRELIGAITKKYPELVIHSHRHYTDGLFVPTMGAAAEAGAHIVDVAIGASVRWYGQGEVLSTAAYIEDEIGLKTHLDKDMIRATNFKLKQIMPYYDRYTAPYFQGIDHDVVRHGMPGGATSSSQEGALKQGYIKLLPYMLKFLEGTRKVVRYHDVTPGSQITWNTAFLAVTGAYKRGGEREVRRLLNILDVVTLCNENDLTGLEREARLDLYRDSNDAFRNLLLGKFGKLPLGFPEDWVYNSAFGSSWKTAIKERTEKSPLVTLVDVDLEAEMKALQTRLHRQPSEEEFIMYLNHPGDAITTIDFCEKFGNINNLPVDVWFEGLEKGEVLNFQGNCRKPHRMRILDISEPDENGMAVVRYVLDSEIMSHQVKVAEPEVGGKERMEKADPANEYHVGSPSNGDLWVTHVRPGDKVKAGEELFNISIMKQEKSIVAPVSGTVRRVIKSANYTEDKKMIPVVEGELLVELGPEVGVCPTCKFDVPNEDCNFCPNCGQKI
ncbi:MULTISPECIES: pyruvate carboxylase [unclassified Pseudodesulfovibrio]|uniref:pyruvate carboxylase n=1 Tax=unclassified Pseudodesulfovibrio TaxID=2661612 RepID=UPI000FEB768B|nr:MULTISPECIES: pyruvate carboxylase [unclassified Pseudodesulfovibrio]MCJ2163808.1 pyruvate carboxylase [Pseudodesulfovibrio sp. S3-i]RWU05944.1 pyruvate carboxylase [Pseudodesulfovibrio sp. S3]